jgi:hypothetical protein
MMRSFLPTALQRLFLPSYLVIHPCQYPLVSPPHPGPDMCLCRDLMHLDAAVGTPVPAARAGTDHVAQGELARVSTSTRACRHSACPRPSKPCQRCSTWPCFSSLPASSISSSPSTALSVASVMCSFGGIYVLLTFLSRTSRPSQLRVPGSVQPASRPATRLSGSSFSQLRPLLSGFIPCEHFAFRGTIAMDDGKTSKGRH